MGAKYELSFCMATGDKDEKGTGNHEHSAAKKKTPTCIPGLELKDPIDGQRHRLTDATLDQRDHPHGRRKGSAFAVLEASATHAGAAKFWKLGQEASGSPPVEEEEEPPLLRQHRLKTSGTRREKTSVLPPPDAELKPGTICDLPSPPPRRRVEQKNGEETTPRVPRQQPTAMAKSDDGVKKKNGMNENGQMGVSYGVLGVPGSRWVFEIQPTIHARTNLAAVATGCGGCGGGGGGGGRFSLTTVTGQVAWLATYVLTLPIKTNTTIQREIEMHGCACLLTAPRPLFPTTSQCRGIPCAASVSFFAGSPQYTFATTSTCIHPFISPTPPVISPDPEPLPRGGCGGCVAPPVPVAGASTLHTLQVQQLNFHFTCLASAALARHGNPREIGDSFDSRDHHESTTLLLSLDSMGAR
uniref:Uncharacterized protein n=1 Tax=Oryza nivara TaxID=4536 RepID=A0A0E0HA55_ORYNI